MSTALDFTVDIGSLPVKNQGPQKMNVGGKTESTRMLETPPPESLDPRFKDLLYRQTEGQPEEFTKESPVLKYMEENQPMTIEPPKPMMDPQLQQILQAQKDMSGIMMANNQPKKGIEFLMERTYTI
tara:strand:+ start:2934 stop:3314 length:381 start_codon:yes stop_codon:yes gene_type:complete